MLGEVTTVYVFLIELGSLLLYCYRVFGVRRRIPSTLLVGIACFAVYYAVNKLADNNVAVNIIFGFLVNYVILKLGFKANVKSAVFHSVLLAGVLTATEFIGILLISGFFGINIADYRSNDVLYAMAVAKAKGIRTIALTGRDGGAMGRAADVAGIVPETETYMIQELHLPVYHALCLMLEEAFFEE